MTPPHYSQSTKTTISKKKKKEEKANCPRTTRLHSRRCSACIWGTRRAVVLVGVIDGRCAGKGLGRQNANQRRRVGVSMPIRASKWAREWEREWVSECLGSTSFLDYACECPMPAAHSPVSTKKQNKRIRPWLPFFLFSCVESLRESGRSSSCALHRKSLHGYQANSTHSIPVYISSSLRTFIWNK